MIAFANEANLKVCVKVSFTVLKIKQVFVYEFLELFTTNMSRENTIIP